MSGFSQFRQLARDDRRVHHARLRAAATAPTRRLAFTIQEALRLASLPGENEGRAYYFRHLRITGLPPNGDRSAWLEGFQRVLSHAASHAVHANQPHAASAPAVYFATESEALETLLDRVLSGHEIREWFWPAVLPEAIRCASTHTHAAHPEGIHPANLILDPEIVVHIIERLRSRPAGWFDAATSLFAAPKFNAGELLDAIPPAAVLSWLHEMDSAHPSPARAAASVRPHTPSMPARSVVAMRHALERYGRHDPRTLWLTTLAIALDSPSQLAAGTAVWRAREVLQALSAPPTHAQAPLTPPCSSEPHTSQNMAPQTAPSFTQEPSSQVHATQTQSAPALTHEAGATSQPTPTSDSQFAVPTPPSQRDPYIWQITGAPTSAAGLFFLLNAMQWLQLPEALAAGLSEASPRFTAHVLHRLVNHAQLDPSDPIRLWLASVTTTPPAKSPLAVDPAWLPPNLPLRRIHSEHALVRAWALAIRRWCWRLALIPVREIICRAGLFSLRRADLDVTLSLDSADIRVRRAGLDLDPGWLPWFGLVVRFHYRFHGEFDA